MKTADCPTGQLSPIFRINAGSIRPTMLKPEESLQPEAWTDGNVVELMMKADRVEITGVSVKNEKQISRCHYAKKIM